MSTTRDEVLALVDTAKDLTRHGLDDSPGDPRLQWVESELNAIEKAIRSEWPLPTSVAQRVSIGRFAAREFEVDHLDLSRVLSELNYHIDAASGRSVREPNIG